MTGGIGLLNGAGVLSLPQIVIDDEIAQMIQRILGDVDISPTTVMADMIERADQMLLQAKRVGRNCASVYDQEHVEAMAGTQ